MLIKTPPSWEISENEVTPEDLYSRRQVLKKSAATSLFAAAAGAGIPMYKVIDREVTKESLATNYNNFYEFSLDKVEVKEKVANWNLGPWSVEISGIKGGKKTFSVDELIKLSGGTEERIYRFRCVEAWSTVIPWNGFSLQKLISKLQPNSSAKFVKMQSFSDHKIGTNMSSLPFYPWPYTEGLTMAEANNPLAFIATGMYGKSLPKQNGAPLRLVVPWKYGFKNIKSIVKIEFVDQQPMGLWQKLASDEYGFYANVNPTVDHPRWSQHSERVIDGRLIPKRITTLMFNGYEKEVAGLYKGLDLTKNY